MNSSRHSLNEVTDLLCAALIIPFFFAQISKCLTSGSYISSSQSSEIPGTVTECFVFVASLEHVIVGDNVKSKFSTMFVLTANSCSCIRLQSLLEHFTHFLREGEIGS